jgi:hypothetical protein
MPGTMFSVIPERSVLESDTIGTATWLNSIVVENPL